MGLLLASSAEVLKHVIAAADGRRTDGVGVGVGIPRWAQLCSRGKIWRQYRILRPRFPITRGNFGYSLTFKEDVELLIFVWIFRTSWPKMGDLVGKMRERVVQCWAPDELVLTFGDFYICANFGENRSRNGTVRVQTDGLTHKDTKRFYNLSHARC